jgi:hypothetical protein
MDCLHSMAPNDEELLSFALGEEPLPEEAKGHLEQCAICQERLARYRETHTFLVSHLYRHSCPDATQLSFYCANLLPADERMHIANHVLQCPLCSAEVAETRRFLADELLPVPLPVSLPARVRRIFATLVRHQAQFVMRGEQSDIPATAWPRQYRADTVDISLHLSRASNGDYILLGIMTSVDTEENVDAFAGVQANLYKAAAFNAMKSENDQQAIPLLSTEVDDIGNIVFSTVPAGEYALEICLLDAALIVEGLTIGSGQ